MKNKILALVIFLVCAITFVGTCDEMYVLPRKSIVYAEPNVQSLKLRIVTQNMLLNVKNVIDNEWCETDIGWIRSAYLGFEPFKESQRRADISSIEVRKRASNFTSSAAAGRGLSNENVRDRNRVSFREYDFDTIKWLEANFSYEYPYLVEFWKKQRGEDTKEGTCRAMCLPIME